MAQMKEQIKTQKKEWNKKEANNLADSQSKTLIVRMLKELSEDLNSIKKIHSNKQAKYNQRHWNKGQIDSNQRVGGRRITGERRERVVKEHV